VKAPLGVLFLVCFLLPAFASPDHVSPGTLTKELRGLLVKTGVIETCVIAERGDRHRTDMLSAACLPRHRRSCDPRSMGMRFGFVFEAVFRKLLILQYLICLAAALPLSSAEDGAYEHPYRLCNCPRFRCRGVPARICMVLLAHGQIH
jgi:hypothetical protein